MISDAFVTESSFDMGSGDPNPDHQACVVSLTHVIWILHIISKELEGSKLHIQKYQRQQVLVFTILIGFAVTEVFAIKACFHSPGLSFLLGF